MQMLQGVALAGFTVSSPGSQACMSIVAPKSPSTIEQVSDHLDPVHSVDAVGSSPGADTATSPARMSFAEPNTPTALNGLTVRLLQGPALASAQFTAQAAKRGASMLRDRRTLLWQVAVPVALVTLSLLTNRAAFVLQQPPLVISRCAPCPAQPEPGQEVAHSWVQIMLLLAKREACVLQQPSLAPLAISSTKVFL